jgi:hypothetical protein
MTICTKCHRTLKNSPVFVGGEPFGPKCAASLIGAKARPAKPAVHVDDERQPDLFPGSIVRRASAWIAAWWNDVTEGIHL